MENNSINQSDVINRFIRAVILIVVSLLLSIVAVSFAMHHMRLQFEEEIKSVSDKKVVQICDIVKMTVHGDEIIADPGIAAQKYSEVFNLMLSDTSSVSRTTETYAMFLYSDGGLSMLLSKNSSSPDEFAVSRKDISEWLSADNSSTVISEEDSESVLVPIADSTGRCVAVFEYKCTYEQLDALGDKLEGRILGAVIITVAVGIVVFLVQLIVPKLIFNPRKGGQHL